MKLNTLADLYAARSELMARKLEVEVAYQKIQKQMREIDNAYGTVQILTLAAEYQDGLTSGSEAMGQVAMIVPVLLKDGDTDLLTGNVVQSYEQFSAELEASFK